VKTGKKATGDAVEVVGLADGTLEDVALAAILPTFHNPRRIVKNDPAVKELAESIERLTMLQPVIVRRLPEGVIAPANCLDAPDEKQSWRVYAGTPGVRIAILTGLMSNGKAKTIAESLTADGVKFELLAGRRRFEAHKLLGRETIKARVLDLTDDQALEVTILENLQREDLSPLEEARGVQSLLNTGRDPVSIADDLGKTVAWVKRRASLTKLIPQVVALMEDGDDGRNVELSALHLEVIARMPAQWQEQFCEQYYQYNLRNVAEFEASVMRSMMMLREAAFDTERAGYGEGCAQSCVECPKRTGRSPDLFHEASEDAAAIAKGERCLDPGCWSLKLAAHVEERKAALQDQHENLLIVSERGQSKGGVLASWDVEQVKKSAPGAKPALIVDGPAAGTLKWVKPLRGAGGGVPEAKGPTLANRRQAWVVKHVRETLNAAPAPWDDLAPAAAMVVAFGTASNSRNDLGIGNWADATKLSGASDAAICAAIWTEVKPVLFSRLNMQTVSEVGPYFKQAVMVAELIGAGSEKDLLARATEALPDKKAGGKADKKGGKAA